MDGHSQNIQLIKLEKGSIYLKMFHEWVSFNSELDSLIKKELGKWRMRFTALEKPKCCFDATYTHKENPHY